MVSVSSVADFFISGFTSRASGLRLKAASSRRTPNFLPQRGTQNVSGLGFEVEEKTGAVSLRPYRFFVVIHLFPAALVLPWLTSVHCLCSVRAFLLSSFISFRRRLGFAR